MSANNLMTFAGHGRTTSAFENKKLGIARRSTPDSEALVSSDDDHEANPAMSVSLHSVKSVPAQRPARRGSWLSEVRTAQRKYSLGGISLASTNGNSQPPTPSAENGYPLEKASSHGQVATSSTSAWESTTNKPVTMTNSLWRNPGSQSSASWSKKEGSRWSEVLFTSAFNSPVIDDIRSPRTAIADDAQPPVSITGFPFDIPLEPNRKTVRSQSYSAGQLDLSSSNETALPTRFKSKRAIPPSLARRKSRAAMETGTEFDLAAVQEDPEMQVPFNGGGDATIGPYNDRTRMTMRHPSTISLDNIELTRSMSYPLGEQNPDEYNSYATSNISDNVPSLHHVNTDAAYNDSLSNSDEARSQRAYPGQQHHQLPAAYQHGSAEQIWSQQASDKRAQAGYVDTNAYHNQPRSYGQFASPYSQPLQSYTQTQQSYDFVNQPGVAHHPASTQSYAPRRSSIGNQRPTGPSFSAASDPLPENVVTQSIQNAALEAQSILAEGEQAANTPSFDLPQSNRRGSGLYRNDMTYQMPSHPHTSQDGAQALVDRSQDRGASFYERSAYAEVSSIHGHTSQARPAHHTSDYDSTYQRDTLADDAMDTYGSDSHHKLGGLTNRNLYLVTFKASRAEIFYRPAGFVGELSEGQMVIVEGDRGLDLGMIADIELNHEQARTLKAEYNRKHYQTLVRFSRNYPHLAHSIENDPDYEERAAQNLADQTLGALGAPSGRGSNLTPKAIRRVATNREVTLLRDKEGNEARAKRICQGKVNTQHLSMEILDAEFQLDYRKLTFYFYAEEYIPFNAIVTDLFKVWKTRIWLSAVNPDTYPAPPRRPGDTGRPPRRDNRGNDIRRDNSYQSAASAARRAYIRGAQDLAMGQFPGALAATFQQNAYQQQQHQQQQQAAFSPPGQVVLPQGPFGGNHRQPHNNLTFGSMPPPAAPQSMTSNADRSWGGNIAPTSHQIHSLHATGMTSPSLLRAAPTVADALASRGELPPAFVPSGQQNILPGLGNLSLNHRYHQ